MPMNPKFRIIYLTAVGVGLLILIYQAIITFPDVNPVSVLIITIPTIVFTFLAYKTYPAENKLDRVVLINIQKNPDKM